MGFGTYAHMTYAEVTMHHPRYCDWVLETMEQDDNFCTALGRFGTFLLLQRQLQSELQQELGMEWSAPLPPRM